ncbi:phosphopantetheine-binding protein [Micromonospora sp. NPDC051296]|uniref:phosphopantetheine-binding protein n=1 Tax=Micromonospora sp. NPDC051296 TaxID=3155046 RepID=UPI0034192AE9
MTAAQVSPPDVEAVVRAAWQEVFDTPHLADDADFFSLGGSSLHAVRIIARVGEDLDLDVSVRAILETRTIRAMVIWVRAALADAGDGDRCDS